MFRLSPVLVNAQIGDDHGRFGEDRHIPRCRVEPARCLGVVFSGYLAGLSRYRRVMRGLDQLRRRREQASYKFPMIVVHGIPRPESGQGRFLCRVSPVEFRAGPGRDNKNPVVDIRRLPLDVTPGR